MADTKKPKDIVSRYDSLKASRSTWESHWQEIADFIYPNRSDFTVKKTKGGKRLERIFDATGIHANELLAAALHGMLTNPSVEWFDLQFTDTGVAKNRNALIWLDSVKRRMLAELADPRSSFTTAMHETYLEFTSFGTAVLFIGERADLSGLLFQARPISENCLSENAEGVIDTIYRSYSMTVRQVVEKFGVEAVSPALASKFKNGKLDESVTIIHAIEPRLDRDVTKIDIQNKAFASYFVERESSHLLAEGGYDEFPAPAPRFSKVPGEMYGRGPGMKALPDVKMLQEINKTLIKSAQKAADPPLQVSDDSVVGSVNSVPGGLTVVRGDAQVRPLVMAGNLPVNFEILQDRRALIRSIFYIDQLMMQESPQMTATEVIQRTEEKLRVIGPMLGRVQAELLGPMIDRCFNIMFRAGKFGTPPREVAGMPVRIVYTSPIIKAQQQARMGNLMHLLQIMGPFMQANPGILDNFDSDFAFRETASALSLPPQVLLDVKDVAAIRQQRAAASEDAQSAAAADAVAGIGVKLAKAKK